MTVVQFKPKSNLEFNKLEWIDETKVYDYYETNNNISCLTTFKRIMPVFFEKYPSPLDWINDDTKEKITLFNCFGINKSDVTNELIYILFWIDESNVLKIKEYKSIIMDYFKDKFLSSYFLSFALYKGFLTKEDIEKIKSIKSQKLKISHIALLCIYFKKNFYDITEEDLKEYYQYDLIHRYSLEDVRLKLNISNIIPKYNRPHRNWDSLFNHNVFGNIFKEYRKILESSSAKSSYISSTGIALKHLIQFLEEFNYKDFSIFNSPSMYEGLIDYLDEITGPQNTKSHIPRIRNFIEYNAGDMYFPTKSVFCSQYWSLHCRFVKKLSRQSSRSHAFSDANLATEIVKLLLNFKPENEIDFLCKQFWLIIASCPCRFSYILNLEAYEAIKPLPNSSKEAYGVYSRFADKAGNKYGQFPILDRLGVNAIKILQKRAKELKLKPLYNKEKKASYVHLFQLTDKPWLLNENHIYSFFCTNILNKLKEFSCTPDEIKASAHSFRHYIATNITLVSKNVETTQTALGHHDIVMTHEYLRSKSSKDTILFNIIDKFKKKEITGKFYLKLVQLLTSDDTTTDELIHALTTEMKLDEFFQKYGKRVEAGYCFSNESCSSWYACWSCSNFIITKNEINEAIKILAIQILELKNMQQCSDFSFDAPSVTKKLDLISCIIKRLTELGLTEDDIEKMVHNCFNNKDLLSGVILND